MPYRSLLLPRPKTAGRRREQRTAARAGVLLASVAAVLSGSALGAGPADAAAVPPAKAGTPAASPTAAQPQHEARVTAAVFDLDGSDRQPTVRGEDTPYDTASIVKVDILAAVLLQAQDAGRDLTAQERTRAEAMIERSDNASANALWRQIGQAPGLKKANERLGLTSTNGGPGPKWGLTQTTASDQIRLLRAVFGTGPAATTGSTALNETSRAYVRTLMTRIASDQSWGVSAAADSGWALKNGWLQRSTTDLWDVNSVGQVTAGGHRYLVAVLSDGNASMEDGKALVERTARAAVSSASSH
ncbi:serine hydrolase [Streptomyces sp. NPDC046831]|uniref:serine hydrolase n=1 Tax=Streptomyces sp. NPDC046831 TaxID=3154805 RepID=UPI00340C2CAC